MFDVELPPLIVRTVPMAVSKGPAGSFTLVEPVVKMALTDLVPPLTAVVSNMMVVSVAAHCIYFIKALAVRRISVLSWCLTSEFQEQSGDKYSGNISGC